MSFEAVLLMSEDVVEPLPEHLLAGSSLCCLCCEHRVGVGIDERQVAYDVP